VGGADTAQMLEIRYDFFQAMGVLFIHMKPTGATWLRRKGGGSKIDVPEGSKKQQKTRGKPTEKIYRIETRKKTKA